MENMLELTAILRYSITISAKNRSIRIKHGNVFLKNIICNTAAETFVRNVYVLKNFYQHIRTKNMEKIVSSQRFADRNNKGTLLYVWFIHLQIQESIRLFLVNLSIQLFIADYFQ